jgi:hypothetical protein
MGGHFEWPPNPFIGGRFTAPEQPGLMLRPEWRYEFSLNAPAMGTFASEEGVPLTPSASSGWPEARRPSSRSLAT